MTFKYPSLTKNTLWKLALVLILQIFIVLYTCLVAIHGTWKYKSWLMQNGNRHRWELGLLSVEGQVDCDATNQVVFYAVCMSVFKNTFGSLGRVEHFICNLPTIPLKIEEEYLPDAQAFSQSCPVLQEVVHYSTATLALLLASASILVVGVAVLTFLAYRQFGWKARICYWITLGSAAVACLFQIVALIIYTVTISSPLRSLFDYFYPEEPELSIIRNTDDGEFGSAVGLTVGSIFMLTALIGLCYFWIPIVPQGMALVQKKRMPVEPASKKELFWAYMPEVFQPNIYVAEVPHTVLYDTNDLAQSLSPRVHGAVGEHHAALLSHHPQQDQDV